MSEQTSLMAIAQQEVTRLKEQLAEVERQKMVEEQRKTASRVCGKKEFAQLVMAAKLFEGLSLPHYGKTRVRVIEYDPYLDDEKQLWRVNRVVSVEAECNWNVTMTMQCWENGEMNYFWNNSRNQTTPAEYLQGVATTISQLLSRK